MRRGRRRRLVQSWCWVLDAPSSLRLGLAADGSIEVEGPEPTDLVTLTASDPDGLILAATEIDLRIEHVPGLLSIAMADDGVSFGTGEAEEEVPLTR